VVTRSYLITGGA